MIIKIIKKSIPINIPITLVCMLLGIILSLQYKSISNNQKISDLENKSLTELRQQLLDQRETNQSLKKTYAELEDKVKVYENQHSDINSATKNLQNEIKRLKFISGLSSVKGSGIVITLDNDAPAYVSETNILNVLNELRALEAQAISINNERVIGISEVREATPYIIINGKQMSSPFIIKAICNSEKTERALNMLGGVKENLERDFIKVKMEKKDDLALPKIVDDGSLIKTDLLTPVEDK